MHHIDSLVWIEVPNQMWFTGFYEYLELSQRYKYWEILQRVSDFVNEDWIVEGDFN